MNRYTGRQLKLIYLAVVLDCWVGPWRRVLAVLKRRNILKIFLLLVIVLLVIVGLLIVVQRVVLQNCHEKLLKIIGRGRGRGRGTVGQNSKILGTRIKDLFVVFACFRL